MQILIPKRSFPAGGDDPNRPLFFLAGPVRGGGDWQKDMALILQELTSGYCTVAVPCRWDETHPLKKYFVVGPDDHFERQLNWERHFLAEAGLTRKHGCVLFWLGVESAEDPHPGPEPYSMDTRGELAEWRMRIKFQNARVVVGAEDEYFGLSQIKRNYSLELGYDFPILTNMEETAHAAVIHAQ